MSYNGKYIGLYNFLVSSKNEREVMNYQKIEKLIDDKLPNSAYKHSAWWSYSKTHTSTLAWLNAGWIIEKLDLGKQVIFKKGKLNNTIIIGTQTQYKIKIPKKNERNIPAPTVDEIEKYLKLWDGLEDYVLQENALEKLFTKTYPENKHIEDVLVKVCALNDFYSTQIMKPTNVAKHIIELDIDEHIKNNNTEIVNKIAMINMGKREINFYSFATKYCSHHKPTVYPIYDYYVEIMLCHFKNNDNFFLFRKDDLKNYSNFICVLNNFRRFYQLDKYNLKQIDKYLWQAGKKHFPRKY
jgi:hypothetical protein